MISRKRKKRVPGVVLALSLAAATATVAAEQRKERRGIDMPVTAHGVHLMVIIATENKTDKLVSRHVSLLHDLTMPECLQARATLLSQIPDAWVCCYPPTEGSTTCQP